MRVDNSCNHETSRFISGFRTLFSHLCALWCRCCRFVDIWCHPSFDDESEGDRLSDPRELLSGTPYELKENAVILFDSDGDNYLLLTDEEPIVASAMVQGTIVAESGPSTMGVIIADSASFEQTGTEVSMADLRDDPSQYQYELIQVEGGVRQLSYTVDAAENQYVLQKSSSSIGPTGSQRPLLFSPGVLGDGPLSIFLVLNSERAVAVRYPRKPSS